MSLEKHEHMIRQRRATAATKSHPPAKQLPETSFFICPTRFLKVSTHTIKEEWHAIQQRRLDLGTIGDHSLSRLGQCQLGPRRQPDVDVTRATEDVAERQKRQSRVVRALLECLQRCQRVCHQVSLTQHHTFGFTRRARGIQNRCHRIQRRRSKRSFRCIGR